MNIMKQGYDGIQKELEKLSQETNRSGKKYPMKKIVNFFSKKPNREQVIRAAKKLVNDIMTAKEWSYEDEIYLMDFSDIISGQKEFFELSYYFVRVFQEVIGAVEDVRYNGSNFKPNFKPNEAVKKALKKFEAQYKKSLKQRTIYVDYYVKRKATELRIPMTKVVNGKRVKRTEAELKNLISKASIAKEQKKLKQKTAVATVNSSVRNMAKKYKIRLTKVVNGKRVKRTEAELKNLISNASFAKAQKKLKKNKNCNCKC